MIKRAWKVSDLEGDGDLTLDCGVSLELRGTDEAGVLTGPLRLVALEAEVSCCLRLLDLLGASLAIWVDITITKTYVVERRYTIEMALKIWIFRSTSWYISLYFD